MAYVVGEPCVNCKYGDCVEVCPVDCFYQDDKQLYINPDECIDCDACRPACPVDAIFRGDEVPVYGDASKPPGYYKEVALKFNYKGKKPVTQKGAVTHGPGWDAKKAT